MNRSPLLFIIALLAGLHLAAEPILWNPAAPQSIPEKFINVTPEGENAAIIEFRTGERPWPMVYFAPRKGESWDFSSFACLSFDIENLDTESSVSGDFGFGPGALLGVFVVPPGEKCTFTFALNHSGDPGFDPLFRAKGMPSGFPGGTNVDTRRIERFRIVCGFARYNRFRLSNLRVHGRYIPSPALRSRENFFPLFDKFGQNRHSDWPEKIRSAAELKPETPLPRLADWNRYGGWAKGPQLKATGFFRVEKYEGKWYFVDPEGRLFFSRGVNSVALSASWSLPKTTGKEALYFEKPAKTDAPIDFFRRNIEQKYGSVDAWKAAQPERLAGWGFNTLGNWSDPFLCRHGRMPYLIDIPLPASTRLPGTPSLWDVYNPEFTRRLEHYLVNTIGWTRDDPFCIGYFIGNEVKFGPEDEAARRIFAAPADRPAKQKLVQFLMEKFSSIDKLNRAWKSQYASWEELAASTRPPERKFAKKEFSIFSRKYIERFYQISRDIVRKCAPNHLYLGSRTPVADIYRAHVNEPHAAYADVVSVNNYALQLDNLKMRGIPDDKPLLISESSVGHESRGMFSSLSYPGLEPGAREDALNCLLKSAARHPQIVGIHHFQFADQPLIGRYDGENYGIGLVDVTDTPYREFVEANRKFSEQLYRFRHETQPITFRKGF